MALPAFDSLAKFLEAEAVYDGTKSPDFQWWGAPQSAVRPKRRKRSLKEMTSQADQLGVKLWRLATWAMDLPVRAWTPASAKEFAIRLRNDVAAIMAAGGDKAAVMRLAGAIERMAAAKDQEFARSSPANGERRHMRLMLAVQRGLRGYL